MKKTIGYLFPEPMDPETLKCFKVYVPDDVLYLAAFWSSYEYLTTWHAWKRDEAHTALDVAAVWRLAYEQARTEYLEGGGCETMTFQLRQNPADPCQLQQSLDGGETWSLAFDYTLCSSVITIPSPYPGSETGASDAAAAAVHNTFQALLEMIDCEAMTRAEYIAAATAYMRTFDASYAQPAALGTIYDLFCAMDETTQNLHKEDCIFLSHKTDLQNCASPDGLFDWLDCTSEAINDWLDDTSDALMTALNQAAQALSGNGWQLAAAGGEGGGAGFGDTCDWIAEFVLTSPCSALTFIQECGTDRGYYSAGIGALSDDGFTSGGCSTPKNRLVLEFYTAAEFVFTRFEAWLVPDSPPDSYEQYAAGIIGGGHVVYAISSDGFGVTSPIDHTISPSACYGLHLSVDHTDGVTGTDAGFSKVRIYGTDAIPPEYAPFIV